MDLLGILEKVLVLIGLCTWIIANVYSAIKSKAETQMLNRKEKAYKRVLENNGSDTSS